MTVRKLGLGGLATILWVALLGALALPALADTAPSVTINSASGLTSSTAEVSGTINPNGGPSATTWGFQYSKEPVAEGWTPAAGVTVSGEYPVGSPESTSVTALAVAGTIEGLQPNVAYKVRLVARNAGGEASPEPEVPAKTLAAKPTITAESASSVKSTVATLEAQLNPNNQPTTFSFEYSTKATGETLEAPITKTAGAAPLEGFGLQTATIPALSGLAPGTPYFFRVVAENATGTTTGAVTRFVTVPTPTTLAASSITASSATLNGELLPLAPETTFSFSYALGSECTGGASTTPETAAANPLSAAVTELQPNATYTACLLASNTSGSQQAASVPFKTLALPPAIKEASESAAFITSTAATLEAQVNPNNEASSVLFEFATSKAVIEEGKGTRVAAAALPPLFADQPVSVFTGEGSLLPRTVYFYRAVAENAQSELEGKPVTGKIEEFTTLDRPLVTTEPAEAITRTTATVSGTVNPGGLETTYHVAYVPHALYEPEASNPYSKGTVTPDSASVGSDYTAHAAGPVELSELAAGEAYDYTIVATNSQGVQYGPDRTFATSAKLPPLVSTGPAVGVGQLSATLTGTVDTRGLASTVSFELGAGGEGALEPATVTGETGTTQTVAYTFNATLAPGTVYFYRVIAHNADGTQAGALQSFTTAGFPAALTFPAAIPFVPYTTLAELAAQAAEHAGSSKPPPKLTNRQKLTKALAVCHRLKKKSRRAACERVARKKYPVKRKK